MELVSPQDRWLPVGDVPGVRGRPVDALAWVCRGRAPGAASPAVGAPAAGAPPCRAARLVDERRRLFGCSRDGTIFEVDFAAKRQVGVIGSGGGGVFCLATMSSRRKASGSGCFAAGCEDGTVKIYTACGEDGGATASGKPELVATLPSAGGAVLSLAWVPGHGGDMGGSVIFAGVADGTIRRYDCATATVAGPISTGTVLVPSGRTGSVSHRWKSTLRMTVENRGLREATKVWALEALSDGTVLSGDSLGHVQIWDGRSGTLTQTFEHNENGADVLCLAVSEDEDRCFASGVDASVRCFQRRRAAAADALDPSPARTWIGAASHRKHTHDVRALAVCRKRTGEGRSLELVVSGSDDARLCTYVAGNFVNRRPKVWYNWPALSSVSVSRGLRLLAVTRAQRIDLFRLYGRETTKPLENLQSESKDQTKCLVKTISIPSAFNLCCSVVSDDGRFLAAADAASLYVFSLEVNDEAGMFDVIPTQLSLPGECKRPGTALRFDSKGRLMCATSRGPIYILQISPKGRSYEVALEHVFKEHMLDLSPASHHFPVVCLDVSSDGTWLAVARFSSGKGAVHVFALPVHDSGRYRHWWSVPVTDAPATCVKFLGGRSGEPSLAVGTCRNEFYIYNLARRSLSHWSNDMGLPPQDSLPNNLTSRSEPVTRIMSNQVNPEKFILV